MSKSLTTPARASGGSTTRLRVLVFTTVFPSAAQPLHGSFVLERIRHLAELAEVRVVAPITWYRALRRPPEAPPMPPLRQVEYPRFWYIPKILLALRGISLAASAFFAIRRLRRQFDFDLIDAHFVYPDGFAAILLGYWFRRPVCLTLRGVIIPLSRRPIGRWLSDWTIRRARRVIAVSENLANRAREGGVPADRVVTIANAVDTSRFRPIDAAAARRRLDVPEDENLLVSVGHISPRKGFQRVLRALPRVLRDAPNTRLAIVGGKGAEEDNSAELHALVERLGLSDRVAFVGARPLDEVALWMAASDVFVLASDFEGCPNVILEALACGRPVVAAKVGDIERMVPPFAGVLFDDPEDDTALAECLLAAIGGQWDHQRIRDHIALRSWDDVAARVMAQWRLAVGLTPQTDGVAANELVGGAAAVGMRSRRI